MVYIIAEAGIDHEGDPGRLTALLDAAVRAKVDAFKIQYYKEGFQGAHRQLPWLPEKYILPLKEDCNKYGLQFIITPHDKYAVDFILNTECVDRVKIGSHDWDRIQFFTPESDLIISCGSKCRDEVYSMMMQYRNSDFLYCVSKYPARVGDIFLREIDDMLQISNLAWRPGHIGYSDHSIGIHCCIGAVAKGATLIEKHMTLEGEVEGRNDTFCSLLPDEWPVFVDMLRATAIANQKY